MQLGYIGLGHMGGALARRLQSSHQLLVYDAAPEAVSRAATAGCTPVNSVAELGGASDLIFLCLPMSEQVHSVLFDEGGLAGAVRPGTVVIDQTSGDPMMTRTMAARLAAQNVYFIDAPVSGGATGAEAGTISIMVGAEDADFERVRSTLLSISPNVFHAGGDGAGHVMKLVNNMLSGAQRLMTFEAMTLAEKNGIDPAAARQILMAGGAHNAYLERIVGPHVLSGNLVVGFTLGLQHKDLRLACQLGTDSGVPLVLANVAREMYQVCINERGAGAQVDTAGLVMDRIAGSHVVPSNPVTEPAT